MSVKQSNPHKLKHSTQILPCDKWLDTQVVRAHQFVASSIELSANWHIAYISDEARKYAETLFILNRSFLFFEQKSILAYMHEYAALHS